MFFVKQMKALEIKQCPFESPSLWRVWFCGEQGGALCGGGGVWPLRKEGHAPDSPVFPTQLLASVACEPPSSRVHLAAETWEEMPQHPPRCPEPPSPCVHGHSPLFGTKLPASVKHGIQVPSLPLARLGVSGPSPHGALGVLSLVKRWRYLRYKFRVPDRRSKWDHGAVT